MPDVEELYPKVNTFLRTKMAVEALGKLLDQPKKKQTAANAV